MDFDRTSNCSSLSNQSDDVKSTVSSLSAVSAYGDEFAELRHLVDPGKYSAPTRECPTPVYNDSGCDIHYEDRIADLSLQLQSTLKLNEKYKNDLFALEKNIELRHHEKFETFLKANRQLTIELISTKDQLERLFKRFTGTSEPSSSGDKYFVQLEQKCHELSSYNTKIQSQLQEANKEKSELEVINQRLKINFQDCKIENETKNACIKELKEKISNQFMEIQALIKSRNMNENALKDVKLELEHSTKSQEWYKNQLAITQNDKKNLLEDVTKCKSDLIKYQEKQNSMNLTLKLWQNKLENLQLETLKEKEKLYHQIKTLSLKTNSNIVEEEKTDVIKSNDKALLNYYKASIQDLQKEISVIKEELSEDEKTVKKLNKDNSDLASHCVILQKTMQQKDIAIEEYKSIQNQSIMELNLFREQDRKKSQEILRLTDIASKLELELLLKKEEKDVIENTVHVIRQQFFAFKTQYDKLKNDLIDKNKQIMNLQNENQQLFMNNNVKICELEEAKEKDFYIGKLRKDLKGREQQITDHSNQIKLFQIHLREKDQLNSILSDEKNSITKEYQAEIQRYEEVIIQYRRTVQDLEVRLEKLKVENNKVKLFQEEIEKKNTELVETKNLKEQIHYLKRLKDENERIKNILQEEIKKKDEDLMELKNRVNVLEQLKIEQIESIKILQEEIKQKDERLTEMKDLQSHLTDFHRINNENEIYMNNLQDEKKKKSEISNESKQHKNFNNLNSVIQDSVVLQTNNLGELGENKLTRLLSNYVQADQKVIENEERYFYYKRFNSKLSKLEQRVKDFSKQTESFSKMMRNIQNMVSNNDKDEEVKELKVLLQVKSLELKEKQKK